MMRDISKREVAELACRILGVTILALFTVEIIVVPVQVLIGISDIMRGNRTSSVGATLLGGSLSAVLHMAVVCFLWTRSGWIARQIVRDEDNASRWPHVRVVDLQVAAFSTLGLLSLIYGVGYFCRSLGVYIDSRYSPVFGRQLSVISWLAMESTLASLAYAALGAWLVFGSRQIVRFIRRLRRPDFDEPDEADTMSNEQSRHGSSNLLEP
jgi:hypothetical protein